MRSNLDLFKSIITSPETEDNALLFYQDDNITIKIQEPKMDKGLIGLILTFISRENLLIIGGSNSGSSSSNNGIQNLTANVISNKDEVITQTSKPKYLNNTTVQILIKVKIFDSYADPPILSFKCNLANYKGNNYYSNKLALPIFITKFIKPLKLKRLDFYSNWQKFSNNSLEKYHKLDCILKNPFYGKNSIMDFLKKFGSLIYCLGFIVIRPEDTDNYHEIEAVGSLITDDCDMPILIQASFVPSYPQEFRLSIRAKVTNEYKYITLTLDVFSILDFFVNFNR